MIRKSNNTIQLKKGTFTLSHPQNIYVQIISVMLSIIALLSQGTSLSQLYKSYFHYQDDRLHFVFGVFSLI